MLKLKQLRESVGLTVPELARISGISRRTIQDIESRGDCRISTAAILCKALGVSLDAFYTLGNDE